MGKVYDLKTMNPDEMGYLSRMSETWDNKLIDTQFLQRHIELRGPEDWNKLPKKEPRFESPTRLILTSPKVSRLLDLGADWTRLPLEVLHMIFSQTDIATLFCIRRLNFDFKSLLEQWPPFRTIMEYGRSAVRPMLRTGASRLWTAPQLCTVLFTSRCELCGDHGELLQLLKLQRCCFRCLSTDRRLLAVGVGFVRDIRGMRVAENDLQNIPKLLASPQPLFWGQPYNGFNWVCDYTIATKYSNPIDSMNKPTALNTSPNRPIPSILRKRAESGNDRASYHENLRFNKNMDIQLPESHPLRLLAAVFLPARSRTISPPHEVTHITARACRGCRFHWNYISPLHHLTHRLYTPNELTKHLRNCAHSRIWWLKLHPPNIPQPLVMQHRFLPNIDTLGMIIPRHNHSRDLRAANANVEHMPLDMIKHFECNGNPYLELYGKYDWNGISLSGPAPNAEITGEDWYGDSLLGDEAVSQASWACAARDATTFVFGREVSMRNWRMQKYWNNLEDKSRKLEWGLDTI